jgi:predicted  nucleic acid-binding Zn-ribbon protein
MYEAKLLTGKTIPLGDATYLHGLEDRLLERYKKFAYPLLRLNGTVQSQQTKLDKMAKKIEDLSLEVGTWKREALDMKREIKEIREVRQESDAIMDKLFEDAEFKALLRQKLREIKV